MLILLKLLRNMPWRQTSASYSSPSHPIQPIQTARHQDVLWLSQNDKTDWLSIKVHKIFKIDFKLTYDTGLYSARDRTEQNSPVKWPDNGLYQSRATGFLFCTRSAPDQPALRFSGRCKLFLSAVPGAAEERRAHTLRHKAPRGPTSLLLTT
jgi:hypothetical protein